jgi:hypothetical protein
MLKSISGGPHRYSIMEVKKADGENRYIVTIARDEKVVGKIVVLSTSSDSAYYNDPLHGSSNANVKIVRPDCFD